MPSFVDRCLLQLRQPAAVAELLKGDAAAPYPRLERLVTSVFRPDGVGIEGIADLTVSRVDPMVVYTPTNRVTGSMTRTQPSYELTDLRADLSTSGTSQWAHLLAGVELHLVASTDPGGVESAVMTTIENIQSFADFRSRFRYLDLDAFLTAHKITTVQQLREAADYLLAEVRLKAPPPFDPQDPANAYDVSFDVALLVLEEIDLGAGLQQARLLTAAAERSATGSTSALLGPAAQPLAVAVVFPEGGLAASGTTADAVDELYALASILPVFANPP